MVMVALGSRMAALEHPFLLGRPYIQYNRHSPLIKELPSLIDRNKEPGRPYLAQGSDIPPWHKSHSASEKKGELTCREPDVQLAAMFMPAYLELTAGDGSFTPAA